MQAMVSGRHSARQDNLVRGAPAATAGRIQCYRLDRAPTRRAGPAACMLRNHLRGANMSEVREIEHSAEGGALVHLDESMKQRVELQADTFIQGLLAADVHS